MIEYFLLNIEYLRHPADFIYNSYIKMTERSDFNKYSIFNLQLLLVVFEPDTGFRFICDQGNIPFI